MSPMRISGGFVARGITVDVLIAGMLAAGPTRGAATARTELRSSSRVGADSTSHALHAALRLDRDRPVVLAIGRLTVMKGQRADARSGPSAQEF
jgi:hypothetical protein